MLPRPGHTTRGSESNRRRVLPRGRAAGLLPANSRGRLEPAEGQTHAHGHATPKQATHHRHLFSIEPPTHTPRSRESRQGNRPHQRLPSNAGKLCPRGGRAEKPGQAGRWPLFVPDLGCSSTRRGFLLPISIPVTDGGSGGYRSAPPCLFMIYEYNCAVEQLARLTGCLPAAHHPSGEYRAWLPPPVGAGVVPVFCGARL